MATCFQMIIVFVQCILSQRFATALLKKRTEGFSPARVIALKYSQAYTLVASHDTPLRRSFIIISPFDRGGNGILLHTLYHTLQSLRYYLTYTKF